jgi:hypothetical protein
MTTYRDHPLQRRRQDHVHLRAREVCPLCLMTNKARGLLVCWACFNEHGMAEGNPTIEEKLRDLEEELELEQQDKDAS